MKKQIVISLVLVCYISSCTSIRMIHQEPKTSFLDQVSKIPTDRHGLIVLLNGREYNGYVISIAADSTSWTDSEKVKIHTVATSELREIIFTNRGKGATQGFLVGATTGFALGFLLVEMDSEEYDLEQGFHYAVGGFLGAVSALLIGLPIGASVGSKDRFVFTEPTLGKSPDPL